MKAMRGNRDGHENGGSSTLVSSDGEMPPTGLTTCRGCVGGSGASYAEASDGDIGSKI